MTEDIEQIDEQIRALHEKRQSLLEQKRSSALEQVRKTIAQFGFQPEDVFEQLPAPRPRRRSSRRVSVEGKAIFRDEVNGLVWHGNLEQKGRKPAWINERIKDGTIERYRVTEAERSDA